MRVTIRQPRYCQARTKKIFDSGDEKYFVLLSHHLMEAEAQWKLFQLIILNIGSHPPSIAPSLHISSHTLSTLYTSFDTRPAAIPVWTYHWIIVIMQVDCCCKTNAIQFNISFEMSWITLHTALGGSRLGILQLQLGLSGTFDLCWKELECVKV